MASAERGGPGSGGGIYNQGTLTITHSTFSDNLASESVGGGLGAGITNVGTMTVISSTFARNRARIIGGIVNEGTLTVIKSNFSGNSLGAIGNSGTLTVTASTFTDNRGGLEAAGAIGNSGTLTVTASTFTDNDAMEGAGIANGGTLIITNSTFSGNQSGNGGGILNSNRGTVSVTSSTFSGNSAAFGGSDIDNSGTLNLANTLMTNNANGDPNDPSSSKDCFNGAGGIINATGINLIEDGSCGASDDSAHFITGDPNVGPLADNGGPTLTHALLAGSIAIDAADSTICAAAPVKNRDQRGVKRPQDGNGDGLKVCDIGAYEFVPPVDACTTAGVLDYFNRADGSLGGKWRGETDARFYRIRNHRVDVRLGGPVYWDPAVFGTSQAAFVTLSKVDKYSPAQGALLKVQNGDGLHNGAIAVAYDGRAQAVRVSTLRPRKRGWRSYGETPATFRDGDKLGGCALADGDVRVYKNDVLLASVKLDRADRAFFNHKRGKVGLWSLLAPKAFVDDFGGGTVKP